MARDETPAHAAPPDAAVALALRAKAHGGRMVLGAIDLVVGRGERVALLGPSGVGKSTLLGVLAGLDRDFDGRLDRGPGRLAMAFQSPRLLPWRTLAQNIALVPGAGGEAAARAALAAVGLGDHAGAYPETCSLGQQRRAALARALAVSPALVLLDEPLVSLDPETARAMRALVARVLDETGAAAIMATHDRREALSLADRVVELAGQPARIATDRVSPLDRAARRDEARVEALHAAWFGPPGAVARADS